MMKSVHKKTTWHDHTHNKITCVSVFEDLLSRHLRQFLYPVNATLKLSRDCGHLKI